METEMIKAWDEYAGKDGGTTVHPMFAAAFAAGWQAGIDDYQNEEEEPHRIVFSEPNEASRYEGAD